MKASMNFLFCYRNLCAAFLALMSAMNLSAAPAMYQFDDTFSGTSPYGAAPWVQTTIQDGSPGTVLLTVANVNLASGEFVSGVYLNLDPAMDVSQLDFTYQSGTSGLVDLTVGTMADHYKADGDGYYDILLGFSEAASGRFVGGNYITYEVTGITGLTASDFWFISCPGGGQGTYYAAAKVQGISCTEGTTSGWIGVVPEPASGVLLVLAAGLWWCVRSRRSR